ncbi:Macrophage colony-stimulating factor 1 receptor [Neophaeococcomyces mojaviensis]|uniref:Macrophage colony-stimulating factor 1 receptor n=1 Tax=Neophaeococcomyces mojaviensis TaxID=3383035 RepID=A0ACC3A1M8_9EURO|nr:Macrophage colony-stimulating factor 1 receptor [Knufia sp. JES_112]
MAGLDGLTAQKLGSSQTFNWTWFIELATCGILVIWFLFYLNRLFATIVSYSIRTYTWHKFRVYVDIKSLQVSLLGGRVFFKGVRYHGENETVYIHNGYITWRYWLRATRQVDVSAAEVRQNGYDLRPEETEEKGKDSDSSSETDGRRPPQNQYQPESRIVVSITGLEWFIYNRTPVYDAIIQDVGAKAGARVADDARSNRSSISKAVGDAFKKPLGANPESEDAESITGARLEEKESPSEPPLASPNQNISSTSLRQSVASDAPNLETDVSSFYSIVLRFFPIGVDCARGAISIGNEQTKAIVVTTFDKARGHIDASASGPADIYRQVFDFDVEHPVVQMKPNPDFRMPQMAAAERIIAGTEAILKRRPWWRPTLNLGKRRRKFTYGLRNLIPYFRRSVESFHGNKPHKEDEQPYSIFSDAHPDSHDWHGLDRYMDEDEGDDHHAWMQIEYARFSTLFDCPHVHLKFYWDVPGTVKAEHLDHVPSGLVADLNGIEPPAYGMHLDVYGGLVNYGPWADRLRAEVQSVFLPAGYKTAAPKAPLPENDVRLFTTMTITVSIKDEITLRVPARESSKDWRWRGRATAVRDAAALKKQQERRHFRFRRTAKRRLGPDLRPFGWISVSAGALSKVRYVMDMYPGIDGYRNMLQVNLKSTRATSSVNHSTLWECKEQDVSADLSNPLGWNQLHTWRFDIKNKNMDLFLLRDHTFLLLDLISDFTAGQKSDYMTFVPFQYIIGIDFHDLKLLLNANDNNIIDNPCDLEENAFLTLGFAQLEGQVDIPMKFFSPTQSSVRFQGNGRDGYLNLKTPSWNTLSAFSEDENMATLKSLSLDGSYNYFSTTSPKLTESLIMNIVGGSPMFILQGYLIRYFMNVKDNYFGDTIHFSTLEEYQAKLEGGRRYAEDDKKPPPKKQNDLDVILSVRAENAAALMPANIYRRDENLRIDVLLIEADMRFTNYYMDLQVNSSPVEASSQKHIFSAGQLKRDATGCQLFIDSVTVYGHRLFGAPPTEPTYLCNWDFDIGEILGECTTDFLRVMISSILSFIYTMDDDENALPKTDIPVVPDVTFLRMRAAGIRTWIVSAETAFLLEIAATTVELNDWANKHFSKYVKVNAPLILAAAVDSTSAYRHRENPDKRVSTLCCFQTSVKLAVLDRKADFAQNRAMQQQHIRLHDARTHRAHWLLYRQHTIASDQRLNNWSRLPPAMPVPMMPEPLSLSAQSLPDAKLSTVDKHSRISSFLTSNPFSTELFALQGPNRGGGLQLDVTDPTQNSSSHPIAKLTRSRSFDIVHSISSPWVKPHFQLQRIRPDFTNMPQGPDSYNPQFDDAYGDSTEDRDFPTLDDALKHDGIFCNLADGILGFCTPELLGSVVTMLNEITPSKPESILDDLQMQVTSSIKKLADRHIALVDDLAFRLPFGHLRVLHHRDTGDHAAGHDQYDFKLTNTKATVRIAPELHSKSLRSQNLVHVNIESLNVEAAECLPYGEQFNSGAELSLSEVGLWLSLKGETRARTQISNIDLITAGKNIDSLAGLIRRSQSVVSESVEQLKRVEFNDRTQHLLYHLTSAKDVPDPPFLSRPSYVLRTADEHVRLHDTWKIVSRLRYVWRAFADSNPEGMSCSAACLHEDRAQARKHVLSSLDRWKSWENPDEDDNPLVQAVYGIVNPHSNGPKGPVNIEAELLLGRAALTLDPGPQQSQAVVRSLDFNFSEKLTQRKTSDWSFRKESKKHRTLQGYCAAFGVLLHWELLSLAERLISLSQTYNMKQAAKDILPSAERPPESEVADLSVVIGADAAAFELESPNVHLLVGVERLKSSFATTVHTESKSAVSLVLNASSGRLRLRGLKKRIVGCKVTAPTIYLSAQKTATDQSESLTVIHSAATCEKLRFHVKEDVLGLLRLVEAVLSNEVSEVQQLVKLLPVNSEQPTETSSSRTGSTKKIQPHIALFLDDYLMQFDLMPYLRYMIAGRIARTSVVPHTHKKFSIQLDIKENQHSFENPNKRINASRSALNMPPATAAVTIEMLPNRFVIDARAAMELMFVEASAVRSCFDAAYQPETIHYIEDVKHSFTEVQRTMQTIFPPRTPVAEAQQNKQMSAKDQRELQYSIHVVLSGVRLHCSAPAIRTDQDYRADLTIVLDATTMMVHNQQSHTRTLSKKPHFDFALQEVVIGLARDHGRKESFGEFKTSFHISGSTELDEDNREIQHFRMVSNGSNLDLYAETAVLAVDLVTFLQARIKSLAAAEGARKLKPLRRLTMSAATAPSVLTSKEEVQQEEESPAGLLSSTFSLELNAICLRWLLNKRASESAYQHTENMVFSVRKIDLKTRRDASARLAIDGLQLQLVPTSSTDPFERTANSALLPEMVFNAAYGRSLATRKFAFKAAGKLVDVRLASNFIIPASAVQRSLAAASSEVRSLKSSVAKSDTESRQAQLPKLLGKKRLASLLIFADFAGAEVTVSPAREDSPQSTSAFGFLKGSKRSRAGRYGQAVQSATGEEATLRSPGIAFQVEYHDNGDDDPTLSTEVRVAASSNTLAPSVVPLILEISSSVTNLMGQDNTSTVKSEGSDDKIVTKDTNSDTIQQATDPTAILGRVKLNAGLWVQKQEFSLTCQPIARVSATARFDEIFVVVNTVQAKDQDRFFSITTTFSNLAASVQHVYSRESTASFAVESIVVSLMNSKHLSGKNGVSVILNISPMKADLNAKQMQDFMLFREIWYPPELRSAPKTPTTTVRDDSNQAAVMQKFQEATATVVLPWHAIVSIQELKIQVDFGQSIGKSDFAITKLWASSKKNSDSEQNLCIGFEKVGIDSSGRMSGFVELQEFSIRTAIRWPMVGAVVQAPLVQGSVGFDHLRAKAAFDYQPFAVVDISTFNFLIYNVRQGKANDRLVGILDGGKMQAFCTTVAAAQVLSISQAFERLIQEKQEAFESSLHELDRYLHRKSVFPSETWKATTNDETTPSRKGHRTTNAPRLQVDVVITLRAIDAGVFMSSFFDETTLKLEAVDVQARFAVGDANSKTHSGLGMSLGQVRLALPTTSRPNAKALGEVSITEVIDRATTAKGGTILKVPRLVASMETWQQAPSNTIEYIFQSTFHGKVDVGWNYSRISQIRRMWENHSRALAQKMNKPLPPSAIKITAEPKSELPGGESQEKITAVVNMPQSKYEYIALEPPIIDTPQLRDLGEATPSLEWIGLHRERLPHVTHSLIIVSLLEVAKEVEDTYSRILGSG